VISENLNNYTDAIFEWGICRGDSSDWSKYEKLIVNRNSLLSRRQKTSLSTDEVIYSSLSLVPFDSSNLVYYVYNNGSLFTWASNSSVQIYSDGVLLSSNSYRYDNNTGAIRFDIARSNAEVFTATITELRTRYSSFGESTISTDYKTYFLANGSWPSDAEIVVYINGQITRGTYIADINNGSIVFNHFLAPSDIVTVFVQFSNSYRLGLKVLDYNTSVSKTYDFGLQYTLLKNLNKYSEYVSTSQPYISENRVLIKSSLNNINSDISINYPFYVSYDFKSLQNNFEGTSEIRWFRTRSGNTLQINSINGFTNYDRRVIERQVDTEGIGFLFLPGDEIYVEVIPNDNFKSGILYTSEIYQLYDIQKPYISDVQIKTSSTIVNNQVSNTNNLTAYYNFTDPELGTDQSIVRWYNWSSNSTDYIYQGATLPYTYLTQGMTISFIVTPFNGTNYGIPHESNIVNIV
jgi:hypothetical protein